VKKKVIVVSVPSRGVVSMWWTRAMLNLVRPLNMGVKFSFVQDDGDEEQIADARNHLVVDAFKMENDSTEVDSIFWVDDDVLVNPGALLALYNHHVPIASGVYFTKCELPEPLIFPGRLCGTVKFQADRIIKDCWGHGMGLCLVKMGVYRSLMDHGLPLDNHGNPQWYMTTKEHSIEDGMLNCGGTEDLYFCQRCRDIGILSLVDCTKHAFGWHYDMASGTGYPIEQFKSYRKAEPIVWDNGVVWQ
jgi:hypothetical protein